MDLIDRQDAIDALERKKDKNSKGDIGGFYNKIIQNDIDTLMHLPSAQPERKKGKWKETDDGWDGTYYVCSECGCPWTLIDGTPFDNGMNYCPNCGAEMEVGG